MIDVKDEPTGLVGRYRVISGGGEAKTAVTNPKSDPLSAYEARHRGGGSYSIMLGEQEVVEKLSKADAEAFNGMTAEDKKAYVEASKKG